MNRYGMEVVGIEQGYRGLIENKYHILTEQDLSGILARGGTILGLPVKNRLKTAVGVMRTAAGRLIVLKKITKTYV